MLPDRRLAPLTALAAAACFSMADGTGPVSPPANVELTSVPIVALGGSGVSGPVNTFHTRGQPMATVSAYVYGVTEGARYPMHTHAGAACGGAGVPVADDLGAHVATAEPGSRATAHSSDELLVPVAHVQGGYYFDVHAPGAPEGAPIGCALFVDY